MKTYDTALKSRIQDRDNWSAIFRHPGRRDPATGSIGRRTRRDLGTSVDTDADLLIEQLNEILRTASLWEPQARSKAAGLFDPRVVNAFYEGLDAAPTTPRALRDAILPLPTSADGYRHILLLGTTGAGKTTVARQILGTDPRTERFPSTSTAKTTVADTEIALTEDGPYRAVVTFADRDEVVDHLEDNIAAAALAISQSKSDREVLRRLLDHVNQRFRFSYILGQPDLSSEDDDDSLDEDYEDDEEDLPTPDTGDLGPVDIDRTATILLETVSVLRTAVEQRTARAYVELQPATGEDEGIVEELLAEELDTEIRQLDTFHDIVDTLLHEIELRFSLLTEDELRRSPQGWPVSWALSTDDRSEFLKSVLHFSSNHARLFGYLLTPLVNGIRVMGPFTPTWAEIGERLVLIDVEGLGHTPKSATALSTGVSKRLNEVDAILLVDNATAPMQAAPVAALKSIATSGNTAKLSFLFTHFDQMKADNFRNARDRKEHILASVDNVLKALGKELGPGPERAIRRRMEHHRYFAGRMHKTLCPERARGEERRTIDELRRLASALAVSQGRPTASGPARPVLDREELSQAVTIAAKNFCSKWQALLGLKAHPSESKEHWTRVKALARRLADPDASKDEYHTLKPVADLREELNEQIYLVLQRPVRWKGGEPDEDERQTVINEITNAITVKLYTLTSQRLKMGVRDAWTDAYCQRGRGSASKRAHIINSGVLKPGAQATTAVSPEDSGLRYAVTQLISEVADELKVIVE